MHAVPIRQAGSSKSGSNETCFCECVCVVTTLPAEKKNHLTVQLSESVSTLPASEDQFPASPPMLKMAAEVEL